MEIFLNGILQFIHYYAEVRIFKASIALLYIIIL